MTIRQDSKRRGVREAAERDKCDGASDFKAAPEAHKRVALSSAFGRVPSCTGPADKSEWAGEGESESTRGGDYVSVSFWRVLYFTVRCVLCT